MNHLQSRKECTCTDEHKWAAFEAPASAIMNTRSERLHGRIKGEFLREMHDHRLADFIASIKQRDAKGEQVGVQGFGGFEQLEDEIRMSFLFGGKAVAVIPSDKGPYVVAQSKEKLTDLPIPLSDILQAGCHYFEVKFPRTFDSLRHEMLSD